MPEIKIVLTFDDGPDSSPRKADQGTNRTEKVLDALSVASISGAFFIQTHVPKRLPDPVGKALVKRAADGPNNQPKHVIGIHTGTGPDPDHFLAKDGDHICHMRRHIKPPYLPDTQTALESDLFRAKQAITAVTNLPTNFVRAPYGYTGLKVPDDYQRQQLKHIYWDVESGDAGKIKGKTTADKLKEQKRVLEQQVRIALAKPETGASLIVLFHDLKFLTSHFLATHIETIRSAVAAAGQNNPVFCSTREEVEAVFNAKTRLGNTKRRCPPNLP